MATLKEMYEHFDTYKKIAREVESANLPNKGEILESVKRSIDACKWYQKWRIDKVYYTSSIQRIDDNAQVCVFREIPGINVTFPHPAELMMISFPSGPYMFGDDYCKDFFDDFLNDIINANPCPDFIDRRNGAVYYRPLNASKGYDNYKRILKNYKEKNVDRLRKLKIEKLQREIERLESE